MACEDNIGNDELIAKTVTPFHVKHSYSQYRALALA